MENLYCLDRKLLLIAEIYFGIFFIKNTFIFENLFLSHKRFWKLLINGRFIQFIAGFLKPLYVLEIGFQNSFVTTAAAFQRGFGQSEHPKAMESH